VDVRTDEKNLSFNLIGHRPAMTENAVYTHVTALRRRIKNRKKL